MAALLLTAVPGCGAVTPEPGTEQRLRAEIEATPPADLGGPENLTRDPARVNALWDSAQVRQAVPVPAAAQPQTPGETPAPAAEPSLIIEPQPAAISSQPGGRDATTAATGRLFFTSSGVPRTCTATVLSSGSGQVIATAAHCLLTDTATEPRVRSQNVMFVPGYQQGAAPAGRWFAEDTAVTSGWERDGDWSQDIGFVRLGDQAGGLSVQDRTGGLGAAFGDARRAPVTLLGYPAAGRYDGQTLQRCAGDGAGPDDPADARALTAPCPMTAGYSGGPWLTTTAPDRVVGVSSHDYDAGFVFGSRLGAGALDAFRAMDATS